MCNSGRIRSAALVLLLLATVATPAAEEGEEAASAGGATRHGHGKTPEAAPGDVRATPEAAVDVEVNCKSSLLPGAQFNKKL